MGISDFRPISTSSILVLRARHVDRPFASRIGHIGLFIAYGLPANLTQLDLGFKAGIGVNSGHYWVWPAITTAKQGSPFFATPTKDRRSCCHLGPLRWQRAPARVSSKSEFRERRPLDLRRSTEGEFLNRPTTGLCIGAFHECTRTTNPVDGELSFLLFFATSSKSRSYWIRMDS
jgi:hypothetical protein